MRDYIEPTPLELDAIRKDRETLEDNRCWKEIVRRLEYEFTRSLQTGVATVPHDIGDLWKMAMSQGKAQGLKRILDLPDELCQAKKSV